MNVHEIGSAQAHGHFRPQRPQGMDAGEKAPLEKVMVQPASEAPGDGGVPGVVRLLQEGHFKGVANVRLHINFYDELQQISRDAGIAAMDSGVGKLTAGLQDTVDRVLEGLPEDVRPDQATVESLLKGFEGTAQELLDAVRQGQMGFDAALAALGEKLDAIAESLKGEASSLAPVAIQDTQDGSTTITPPPASEGAGGETGTSGPSGIENPEGTQPLGALLDAGETPEGSGLPLGDAGGEPVGVTYTLDDAMAELKSEFADLLAGLKSEISGQLYEPVFEAPNNNGRAFAKFLEIYNRLGGEPETQPEAQAPVAALDELI